MFRIGFIKTLLCSLCLMVLLELPAFSREYNNTSFERTHSLALQGDVQSQFELGRMYSKGYGTDIDPRLAMLWYNKAILKDHPEAEFELGMMYLDGILIESNYEQAFLNLEKAASHDHPQAIYQLGQMCEKGLYLDFDLQKAKEYYEKAVTLKNIDAKYALGRILLYGTPPIKQDSQRALQLLKDAALSYQFKAQCLLGQLYANGEFNLEQSYKYAIGWYSNAAMLGYAPCQYRLAQAYHLGYGVKRDIQKALNIFKRAADQGHLESLYQIGVIQKELNFTHSSLRIFEEACTLGHYGACVKAHMNYPLNKAYYFDEQGNITKIVPLSQTEQ